MSKAAKTNSNKVSRSKANKITEVLRNEGASGYERQEAIKVVQQWRAQHVSPTWNCFKAVRKIAREAGVLDAVVVYRMKRIFSILSKVSRPGNDYKVGALDDIGGCRIIVKNREDQNKLQDLLSERLSVKAVKDYVDEPQEDSGYRSCHLISKWPSDGIEYRVEIQLRTKLQHYWATAVEAASEIYGVNYKSPDARVATNEEDTEKLEFFRLVSLLFEWKEKPDNSQEASVKMVELRSQLLNMKCTQDILKHLKAADDGVLMLPELKGEGSRLFVLKFSPERQNLDVEEFGESNYQEAFREYERTESEPDEDCYENVVLVYAEGEEYLDVAYPNYSASAKKFVEVIEELLG